jgi:hypothetical protein
MPVASTRPGRACSALAVASALALLAFHAPSVDAAKGKGKGKPKASLSVSGPLSNARLCTKYTYRVRLVSRKSYKKAFVNFFAPPSEFVSHKAIKLHAGKAWRGTFTAIFTDTGEMTRKGVEVSVLVRPPHGHYRFLASKVVPVKPAAGQPATALCPNAPPPIFGA